MKENNTKDETITEPNPDGKIGAVLVIGGGVAGIQASLDLADSGYYTYLVEQSSAIGGTMSQLDKTFPTNDCSLCILSPKLVECGRHPNIEILTNTTVSGITGAPGNFTVSLVQEPRYVDEEKCVGCGVCAEKCPTKVRDTFNEGLAERKAIYVKYPQAVPLVYMIDKDTCTYLTKGKCRLCEKFCPSKAVDFEQKQRQLDIQVGSLILAIGFDEFEAAAMANYGYGRYPNVVSSIEFERLMNASGPFHGEILRPSDKTHPKKIAWIQCVGSRDTVCGNGYCSSVCCMYATKEAIIAKEHEATIEPTIFYIDIRAQGKGFESYVERAQHEHGVRYIRSMVSRVAERPQSKNLFLTYIDDRGMVVEEEFDLVVLSVGLRPSTTAQELSRKLGIELDKNGFCATTPFSPVSTSKPGVYVCGLFNGPKDIPETVAEASGAVAFASGFLSPARGSLVKSEEEKKYPQERDVSGADPRIGVFVCHCGINIGGIVDVPAVKEYARGLPHVVYAEEGTYTCSQDFQEKIKEAIREHNLNRIVVASCSPRTHEPLFQETLREAGLNKYLFEMANIRDQCSWVHMHDSEGATRKAQELVRMIVAKARLLKPLEEPTVEVTKKGLVIGGGLAGMIAALQLAEQGFACYLVEKGPVLGGNLRTLSATLEGHEPQALLTETIEKVYKNPLITVYTNSILKGTAGYLGNFTTSILCSAEGEKKGEHIVEHGVVIVATGGEEFKPTGEFLYGKDVRVITQLELEDGLARGTINPSSLNSVAMIQCVGSRIPERPYCSRVCCQTAVKNARRIKALNPHADVHVLYRDMRTYGFQEEYYLQARKEGITFVRYELASKPEVSVNGGSLKITCYDPVIRKTIAFSPDLVILSSAIIPGANQELAKMLKVPLTSEGFFLEAHVKLRPVDFATDGIFLCGMAHFPKGIEESIAHAAAAAARASIALSQETIKALPIVSSVDEKKCIGCGLCESLCAFSAIRLEPHPEGGEKAVNIVASCKGCGVCASSCPQKAITMKHFEDAQLLAQIQALMEQA